MPPTPRKKAVPKWKLYIPKSDSPIKSILTRGCNGRIAYPETRADAEKLLELANRRAEKNKYYPVSAQEKAFFNFEEHMQEVPLSHTLYGPITLLRESRARRGGVSSVAVKTSDGFYCDISMTDLLEALKKTLVAEGMIFGTWGIKNHSGDPMLYLIGGVNHADKQ